MGVPNVKLSIEDGALGLQTATGEQDLVLFGTCTGGTVDEPVAITSSQQAAELLGVGPLAEAAGYVADRGGATVWCVRVAASAAGAMGAWTITGGGTAAVGSTGAPFDNYEVRVRITAGGTVGEAKFQVSLDGGFTYGPEATSAATFELDGTNLTLTFAAGTYVLGAVHASDGKAPGYDSTNLATAIDAWRASGNTAKIMADVGVPADAAAGATIATMFAAKADAMETAGDYVGVLLQAPKVALASLATAYAEVASKREGICATFCRLQSASGRSFLRPVLWAVLGETARRPISEDLGRVRSGAIPAVQAIEHDEESNPGFDAAQFIVLRRVKGRRGFYVNNPRLRSPAGSDFDLLQMRRVMDVACDATRGRLLDYLNETIPVQAADLSNPAIGGTIDPAYAGVVDNDIQEAVSSAVVAPGHAGFSQVRINRTDNILSTRKLRATIRLGSNTWAKQIEATIGFAAPSLTAG